MNTEENGSSPGFHRFAVLGTFMHSSNCESVRSALADYMGKRQQRHIVTVNVDFLALSARQAEFRRVVNGADLAVVDGQPLVWIARYLGLKDCGRVTGSDLINMAANLSAESGARLFFLGSTPEAVQGAKECLEENFPGVNICGSYSPAESAYPFPSDLNEQICERIRAARPDVLFVAFGAPKQELWIRDHLDELGGCVAIGIGGSFNFFSGRVSRAPYFMQRFGLEWVYRLWKEPKRLMARYIGRDIPFMGRAISAEILARFHLKSDSPMQTESYDLGQEA